MENPYEGTPFEQMWEYHKRQEAKAEMENDTAAQGVRNLLINDLSTDQLQSLYSILHTIAVDANPVARVHYFAGYITAVKETKELTQLTVDRIVNTPSQQ